MRTRVPLLILALTIAALPATLGCASASPGSVRAIDSGAPGADAAASSDAGPGFCLECDTPDGAGAADAGARPPEGSPEGDLAEYANACLDGRDQDGNHDVDCADPSCGAAPSCCVGSTTELCCTGVVSPVTLAFDACDDTSCAPLDGLVRFGSPGPIAVDHAIAPIADVAADSGAISPLDVDPRAGLVTLSASIAVPSATTAIDAVAFGLTTSTEGAARMSSIVAVVVSASRGDVTLLVGGEIAGAFAAPTDGDFHTYAVTVGPTGDVHVSSDGGALDAHVALPAQPLHAVVFGRATNPGSTTTTQPARLRSLEVAQRGCDAPTALSRASDALSIVDHTSAAVLSGLTAPSVATRGSEVLLAFAAPSMGGGAPLAIFIATKDGAGGFAVENNAPVVQPVVSGMSDASLTDPVLRDDGDHWTLFATQQSGGTSELVMSVGGADHALVFSPPSVISVTGLTGLDSPAPIPGSTDRIVARHGTDAESELVLLELTDLASGAYAPEADLCGADDTCGEARGFQRILAARALTFSFDADEVRSPSVILVNHVYRLYYAGRRGSRWSIGMLIAADLGFWRAGNGGLPVLDPDGAGFDAVSVSEPSVVEEDGVLSLYYLGSDGVDRALGVSRGSSFGL
jgi:hypothetical protein